MIEKLHITIVNYDHKTYIVQEPALCGANVVFHSACNYYARLFSLTANTVAFSSLIEIIIFNINLE